MFYEQLNAPMVYEDGIPAYKAGDWQGIKSCKFMPTRKIIHPVDHVIFFGSKSIINFKDKFNKIIFIFKFTIRK